MNELGLIKFLVIKTTIALMAFTVSCNRQSSCRSNISSTGRSTFSGLYGGFIEIARYSNSFDKIALDQNLEAAQVLRTTAHFRILPVDQDEKNFQILMWTTDNTLKFDSTKDIKINIYHGGGYTSIGATHQIIERTLALVKKVDSLNLPADQKTFLKKFVVDSLFPQLSSESLKNHEISRFVECIKLKGNDDLCFDTSQLQLHKFTLTLKSEQELSLLKSLYSRQKALWDNQSANPDSEKELANTLSQRIETFGSALLGLSLSKNWSVADKCRASDSNEFNCRVLNSGQVKGLIGELFSYHPLSAGKSMNTYPSLSLASKAVNDSAQSLSGLNLSLLRMIEEKSDRLYFHTNSKELRYVGTPLQSLGSYGFSFLKSKALNHKLTFYLHPAAKTSILLSRADNGSILSLDGIHPISVISNIENKESGGAVLRPLPPPNSGPESSGSLDAASGGADNGGC